MGFDPDAGQPVAQGFDPDAGAHVETAAAPLNPNYIALKAKSVGYSGLDPREQRFIDSQYSGSQAAANKIPLDYVHTMMDARAAGGGEIDPVQLAAQRTQTVGGGQHWLEDLQQQVAPTASAALAAHKAGMGGDFGQYAQAIGRDIMTNAGRGARFMANMPGAAIDAAFGRHEAGFDAEGNPIAIPADRWGGFREAAQGFADPSGIAGDPSLVPLAFAPLAAPEAIGARVAELGLPSIGKAMQEYPKLAGVIAYPAQGVMQGIGAAGLSQMLTPRRALPDASGVGHASMVPVGTMSPAQLGVSAAGGLAGMLGHWLSGASLEAVPGVMRETDNALRLYGVDPRQSMEKWGGIIDRAKAFSEGGMLDRSARLTRMALGPMSESKTLLSPKTEMLRDALRAKDVNVPVVTGEDGLTSLAMRYPQEGAGIGYTFPSDRYSEFVTRSGAVGDGLDAMTKNDLLQSMLEEVHRAKAYGSKALNTKNIGKLQARMRDIVEPWEPLDPSGRFAYSEIPGLLGALNKPAYDIWKSDARAIGRELGKIGRETAAPLFWENQSLPAELGMQMRLAREQIAESKAIDQLVESGRTGRLDKRQNAIGWLGEKTGGNWMVPLTGRKVGNAMQRSAAAAAQAGRTHEGNRK